MQFKPHVAGMVDGHAVHRDVGDGIAGRHGGKPATVQTGHGHGYGHGLRQNVSRAGPERLYAIASSEMAAYNDEPMYKQIVFLLNDWRGKSLYWQINISNEFFSLRYYK